MYIQCIWYMLRTNYKLVLFVNRLLVYKQVSQFVNWLANFDKVHYHPVHAWAQFVTTCRLVDPISDFAHSWPILNGPTGLYNPC